MTLRLGPSAVEGLAQGTETCGCCDGVDPSTPKVVDNRMGLSAIVYRIGDYADFRDSMLAGLSSTEFAALRVSE